MRFSETLCPPPPPRPHGATRRWPISTNISRLFAESCPRTAQLRQNLVELGQSTHRNPSTPSPWSICRAVPQVLPGGESRDLAGTCRASLCPTSGKFGRGGPDRPGFGQIWPNLEGQRIEHNPTLLWGDTPGRDSAQELWWRLRNCGCVPNAPAASVPNAPAASGAHQVRLLVGVLGAPGGRAREHACADLLEAETPLDAIDLKSATAGARARASARARSQNRVIC